LAISTREITPSDGKSLRELVSQYEKNLILETLDKNDGNISQTARDLEIDRSNLHRKLRQWEL